MSISVYSESTFTSLFQQVLYPLTPYRDRLVGSKVVVMANLTMAELKARASEALQTDGFTDLDIRKVGKDGSLYVGRAHGGEEVILIFLRGGRKS